MCSLPMAKYYIIKDVDRKVLYLRDDQLLLGDPEVDDCCAEKICILPNRALDRTKVPILLGIHGGSRCLACVETEEGPSLQLEVSSQAEGIFLHKAYFATSLIGQALEEAASVGSLVLQLDALPPQDVNIEDLYKGGEQVTRFTFFQSSLGSAFRLEAAAWPGWFLCGPAEARQPVRLAKESDPSARTEFYFEQSR